MDNWNGSGDLDGRKGEKGRQGREEGKRRPGRIERPQTRAIMHRTEADSSFRRGQTSENRATRKGVRATGRRQCRVKKADRPRKQKDNQDSKKRNKSHMIQMAKKSTHKSHMVHMTLEQD